MTLPIPPCTRLLRAEASAERSERLLAATSAVPEGSVTSPWMVTVRSASPVVMVSVWSAERFDPGLMMRSCEA